MDLRTEVANVVADFTQRYKMFTAYDVTKMVRHRASQLGLTDHVPHGGHNGVRNMVHDLFFDGDMGDQDDYTRTSVMIDPNKGITAWVFHDPDDDPTVYDSVWVEREIAGGTPKHSPAVPSVSSNSATVASQDDDDDEDDDSVIRPDGLADYVVPRDQRGRVCVPAKALKDIAPNDDLFHAVVHNDEVTVHPNSNSPYPPGTPGRYVYFVDKSGNIRISRTVLAKSGLDKDYIDVAVDAANRTIVLT